MMDQLTQKPLSSELSHQEMIKWVDPTLASRAEQLKRLRTWLASIARDDRPQAAYSRQVLEAGIARIEARAKAYGLIEKERDQAREALAAAVDADAAAREALAVAEATGTPEEQDAAAVRQIRAGRELHAARAELFAALSKHPPPDGAPGVGLAFSPAIYEVDRQTGHLAEISRHLLGYQYTGRREYSVAAAYTPDVHAHCITYGRSLTLDTLWWVALSEHEFLGDAQREQVFALRWVTACGMLGIPCDRDALELPPNPVAA